MVTLLAEAGAQCWGMAYRVGEQDRAAVLANLDHREKNGYARYQLEVTFGGEVTSPANAPATPPVVALVYIATEDNPDFAGPASIDAIAAQIRRCRGPSGDNTQYVLALAEALTSMGAEDAHVSSLADRLRADPSQSETTP